MDTLFFILAKLLVALIRVETWIVLALALIVLAQLTHRRHLALSAATLAALLTLCVLPLGDLLLRPIESAYPANPNLTRVDGIIVLGGGGNMQAADFWGQAQLSAAGGRYLAALDLARRFPRARLLFTGGSGALLQGSAEAAMAGQVFRAQGIAPERLLLEGQARNTAENARLSLRLAAPTPGEVWVLVTSAFHMPRAMRSFKAAGWSGLTAYPTDHRTAAFRDGVGWDLARNLSVLNTAIKELVGQLAYRLTSR